MKILFLSCMTLLFTTHACKLQQPQGEDKGFWKFGKGALKASDSLGVFTRHIDELLKSGKKSDYAQLIDMLKKRNKSSYKATRAFHQLVVEPLDELDAAFKKLETARLEYEKGGHKGFFLPEAMDAARADVAAKLDPLIEATRRHNKALVALEEYQLKHKGAQFGKVRVLLRHDTLVNWRTDLLNMSLLFKLSELELPVLPVVQRKAFETPSHAIDILKSKPSKGTDKGVIGTFIVLGLGTGVAYTVSDYYKDQNKDADKTEAEDEDKLKAEN